MAWLKGNNMQTFNSLVCGPLKTSDLAWIIVANYFNYMLTQLPRHSQLYTSAILNSAHDTQKAFEVTELTQVSKTYSASFSSI